MVDEVEKEVRGLRERLLAIEVESRSDRRWLIIIGTLLLGILGYTNFVALPNEVESQLPAEVTEKIKAEAPRFVRAQFTRWLNTNNGEAILESLHRARVEVERIEARAKADEASIQAYLKQARNIKVGELENRMNKLGERVDAVENIGASFFGTPEQKSLDQWHTAATHGFVLVAVGGDGGADAGAWVSSKESTNTINRTTIKGYTSDLLLVRRGELFRARRDRGPGQASLYWIPITSKR